MAEFDEQGFLAGANMPTDEQIERAAILITEARGVDSLAWPMFKEIARDILVVSMNQTKIMIGR